ncbi:alginate O-acetyltransferase AlgX-related protein [Sulfitobacter aestuariivivens]
MAASIADILAQHPDTKDLARGQFLTQPVGAVTLPSVMRAQLQLACQDTLPTVAFAAETTRPDGPVSDSVGVAAVIGTEFTGTAALNFSGYLSAASGLRVLGYGVAGGGAFAAMSSYLTSVDFRAAPPQVLVWEFPLWTSLANHGDQPMKELIAAGGESCSRPLTLGPGSGPGRVVADLQGLDAGQDVTLALDTDGAFVSAVRFHFRGADDLVRPRSIYRHPDQLLTGRFYMPLSGLEATGLRSVEIEIPQPYGPQPSLTACIRGATE